MAPDGRSGKPELDLTIDALVSADAARLSRAYPELAGREHLCADVIGQSCTYREIRVPTDEWTRRLASAKRSLYAVATAVGVYTEIVLVVESESRAGEAWIFAFDGITIRGLTIYPPEPGMAGLPRLERMGRIGMPSPAYSHDQFFVLPPADDLPRAPLDHPISTKSGDTNVDALLSVVRAGDVAAFAAAIPSAGISLRRCWEDEGILDVRAAGEWATEHLPRVRNVVSVINLPVGYQPVADHLIVLRTQVAPYFWGSIALLELDGKLVSVIQGEDQCGPDRLRPPESFVVEPPVQGLAAPDPARRSGITMIDAVLEVLQRGNEAEIIGLLTYRLVPCGIGGPACLEGVPNGALVDAIPNKVCMPGFETRDQAPGTLSRDWSQYTLYAATSLNDGRDGALVVLAGSDGPFGLELEDGKIVAMNSGCGPENTNSYFDGTTSYLLPPL